MRKEAKNVLKREVGRSVNNERDQRLGVVVPLTFGLFLISGFDIAKFDMTPVTTY